LPAVAGVALTCPGAQAAEPKAAQKPKPAAAAEASRLARFADFGHLPPASEFHPARTFKLSQDYPTVKPPIDAAVSKILAIDYTKDWRGYAGAVLDYVLQGNIENRPVSEAFFFEDNKVRRWYHVPWQHWGDNGREGLHGLTAEGPSAPFTLGPGQKDTWATYAVGFYNARGGYAIGRVWPDSNGPRIDALRTEGFPVGTVVAKLLFTTAPVSQATFLSNPLDWLAYAKFSFGAPAPAPRHVTTVHLIQMDIMVRDDRAKATGGWVFGTFVYNGALAQPVLWRNLTPLGLQWSNDPQVRSHLEGNAAPTKTLINPDLKGTVINTDPHQLPPMHLGFGLRLSGPVDNALSSCKSCHSTAQFPVISNILPAFASIDGRHLTCDDPQWWRWFRDLGPTESFDKEGATLDNSLQLAGSIQNYLEAKSLQDGGHFAGEFWKGERVTSVYGLRGAVPPDSPPCKTPVRN
jgi:hypothetical protein